MQWVTFVERYTSPNITAVRANVLLSELIYCRYIRALMLYTTADKSGTQSASQNNVVRLTHAEDEGPWTCS